jgi:uncharacterized protein (TIGR03067 family)
MMPSREDHIPFRRRPTSPEVKTMISVSRTIAPALTILMVASTSLLGDDAKDASPDLKKMQGTWSYTTRDGGEGTWVFKDDVLSVKLPSRSYTVKLKLDPKAKPHPIVNMNVTAGPDDAKGQDVLGIYQFDGESGLTICIDGGTGSRPKDFEFVEGQSYVFKLKKK